MWPPKTPVGFKGPPTMNMVGVRGVDPTKNP